MHLIFKEIFLINLFFLSFIYMKFIFENKKKLFLNNISNMWALHIIFFFLFYSFNLMCMSIFIIMNKKIILIKKFSKHNRINIMSCKIKYLDLHIFFNFFNF